MRLNGARLLPLGRGPTYWAHSAKGSVCRATWLIFVKSRLQASRQRPGLAINLNSKILTMNRLASVLYLTCPSRPGRFASGLRPGIGLVLSALLPLLVPGPALAQANSSRTQLANIVVDAAQLDQYKAALEEEIEASLRSESGVLMLYAVADKKNPTHITILERYASEAAYRAHLQAPHFLKYKATVKDMVKSLELLEATPIAPKAKPKN